jgi:hypothetical protein
MTALMRAEGIGTRARSSAALCGEGGPGIAGTLGGNNNDVNTISNHGRVLAFAETAVHDPTCIAPQVLGFEAFTCCMDTSRFNLIVVSASIRKLMPSFSICLTINPPRSPCTKRARTG